MRKLIVIIAVLFFSLRGYAQPTQIYIFPNVNSMKAYYGAYSRAHVADIDQDFQVCSPCTADEASVFAGVNGRKWRRVRGFQDVSLISSIVGDTMQANTSYISNSLGEGDTILIQDVDTLKTKRIEMIQGAGVIITKNVTAEKISYTISSSGGGAAKVVPDGNYTILSGDYFLVLPDPTTTRTLTLPAASTMPGQTKKVYNRATAIGEWVLSGSFVQDGSSGPLNEDFVNSGIGAGEAWTLISTEVSTGVWKWIQSN